MKVCKFGGSSMADASSVKRVVDIIGADEERKYVVASAPGKRFPSDVKITDALYGYFLKKNDFCDIEERFTQIADELNVSFDIRSALDGVKRAIDIGTSDFAASRGEYLSALLLAKKLGAEFVDSADCIRFDEKGELMLEKSKSLIAKRLDGVKLAVIPGFYGASEDGKIKTFSRGGSDITGAIVASAVKADIYENWTDVDGFLSADPKIVNSPKVIDALSYKELRELAYMGANVLHPDAIFPVRSMKIPINIKNTFNPFFKGTMIVPDSRVRRTKRVVTGVAGRTGVTLINIEKEMMNREIGFGRRVLSVFEEEGISFEHIPSGIDTLSIVICDEYLSGKRSKIVAKLKAVTNADKIEVHEGLSLIATVGHNMASRQGTAATLFSALAQKHINVRMIDLGSSELNIIIGVDTFDYEKAINAIYQAFVE